MIFKVNKLAQSIFHFPICLSHSLMSSDHVHDSMLQTSCPPKTFDDKAGVSIILRRIVAKILWSITFESVLVPKYWLISHFSFQIIMLYCAKSRSLLFQMFLINTMTWTCNILRTLITFMSFICRLPAYLPIRHSFRTIVTNIYKKPI